MAAAAPSSDATGNASDGPVLTFLNKRLRGHRKKLNRILQMEESLSQGKPLNKEQEDVLRSKPAVTALIDELEKLRQPLASAVSEEISLAVHRDAVSADDAAVQDQGKATEEKDNRPEPDHAIEDLLNLLYFGSLFDVKSQSDFNSTVLTRTHERGCCLTYDYVTDDETVPLSEGDLDLISMLSGLLISRPVDSNLSHKNALQRCIQHAKLWLANSDQPIEPDATNVTYAGLRERLDKILASDYYTTTPEMKAAVEVAAAAAAGNYAPFQVPVPGLPVQVPLQVEVSSGQYLQKDEETTSYHEPETGDYQSGPAEDLQKDELETENHADFVPAQQEQDKPLTEMEQNQKDIEHKEQQYVPRRPYQNHRGGRGGGGGRRPYSNGRGGRGGRGGGSYQNGRSQYYDQSGNYYPRNYHNNRGRGGRGGGHAYNHHGSGVLGGHAATDVGVAS
ncbi:hypothetical protein SLE2022_202230 [Rubroshorea leprosula]